MGEFAQAARDLVDRANAGDEVAWATLKLVGDNCRSGRMPDGSPTPFRAYLVNELALRYAREANGAGFGEYAEIAGEPEREVPRDAYEWLWRRAARGTVGDRPDLFGVLQGCKNGKEAVVTAFAMGPQLTDRRLDGLLATFRGDPVGAKLAETGMSDPEGVKLAPILDGMSEEEAETVAACHFIGVCLMAARVRQCILSGNLSLCKSLQYEFGSEKRRRW